MKTLTTEERYQVEFEVKQMLHASRDAMRNRFDPEEPVGRYDNYDPKRTPYSCFDSWYGEAFGIMRGLKALGYGYFGPINTDEPGQKGINLKRWFSDISAQVLADEGWKLDGTGNGECAYCLDRYGKDDSRRRPGY